MKRDVIREIPSPSTLRVSSSMKVIRIFASLRQCRWPLEPFLSHVLTVQRQFKPQTIKFIFSSAIKRRKNFFFFVLFGVIYRETRNANLKFHVFSDPSVASEVRSELQECAIAVGLLMFGIILERFIEVLRESLTIGADKWEIAKLLISCLIDAFFSLHFSCAVKPRTATTNRKRRWLSTKTLKWCCPLSK